MAKAWGWGLVVVLNGILRSLIVDFVFFMEKNLK
jgi:hypothetical protein